MSVMNLKNEKTLDFIARSKKTHGEKYCYQKSNYINS